MGVEFGSMISSIPMHPAAGPHKNAGIDLARSQATRNGPCECARRRTRVLQPRDAHGSRCSYWETGPFQAVDGYKLSFDAGELVY
jgi:hypothetical protein